jgi:hypothetical protein
VTSPTSVLAVVPGRNIAVTSAPFSVTAPAPASSVVIWTSAFAAADQVGRFENVVMSSTAADASGRSRRQARLATAVGAWV